jgi:hypothetical protein
MKSFLRSIRTFLTVCLFSILLFSYTLPSFAAPMRNEPNPNANAAAKKYEQVSREPLEAGHPGPTLEEAQEKAGGGGVNEIQGKVGIENMKRPSNSGGLPTVEENIKEALEAVEGKVGDIVK